jgi:selenocysteine-specific translation elongation factor
MIKGTSLERFQSVTDDTLWSEILKLRWREEGWPSRGSDRQYFNVKGVGTVILGIVTSGKVRLHDDLVVDRWEKVNIKGIQSHDKDIQEAETGTRVVLTSRVYESEDLRRGYVICTGMEKSSDIILKFGKSRFFRQEISVGTQLFLSAGLQVVTCIVESVGDILS